MHSKNLYDIVVTYHVNEFIFVGIVGFILSFLVSFFIQRYASRFGLIDIPNDRSSHMVPTPRGGGIAILITFVIVSYLTHSQLSLTVSAFLLAIIGLIDDLKGLSPCFKFICQLICIFILLGNNNYNFFYIVFYIVFIISTVNFFNFMDGINGMASMTGIVAFIFLAFYSIIIRHDIIITKISVSIVFSCLAFLPFNVPNARLFMGDVGSTLLGFIFAAFVVKLSYSVEDFLCLSIFLSTFYADSILTIIYRLIKKENIIKAHKNHIYQNFSNIFGIAHWKISIVYATVQILFAIVAFLFLVFYKKFLIALVIIYSISFVIFYIKIKYYVLKLNDNFIK